MAAYTTTNTRAGLTIRSAQIEQLLVEAQKAGDDPMVEVCRKALGRHGAVNMTRDEARAECQRVILSARAMQDTAVSRG